MIIRLEKRGFDDFDTEIYHICKLFFDSVEWYQETDEREPDARIRLEVSHSDHPRQVLATAQYIPASGEVWSSREDRLLSGLTEEEIRRETKRAIGAALVTAMEQATGLHQPWGILTGVRPTKLFHQMLQDHSLEECKKILREEYRVTEPKLALLADIVQRQLKVVPDLYNLNREVSLYVGIPFCPTKCAYCTFPAYDIRGHNGSVEGFLEGLDYEIRRVGEWIRRSGLGVTTVYWGGGTPTSIEADQIDRLFQAMHDAIPGMDRVRELTVEAGRPDTITPEKIQVLKRWKVDRISINPQSFTQSTLDTIGRYHTVKETIETYKLCRELGMNNINMDLIIGLPNEGVRELARSLEETEKLRPESLTIHTLSFKRASRMTQNREQYEVAGRDEVQRMVELAQQWTAAHGYYPYYMYRQKNMLGNQENVGYSLEGFESLYNIIMMEERQTIIGLGCGAVSKVVGSDGTIERFPNPKEPSAYNRAYEQYTEKKLALLDEKIMNVN